MLQQVAEKINILDDIEQRQVLAICTRILAQKTPSFDFDRPDNENISYLLSVIIL